jgi:hypothetical protein
MVALATADNFNIRPSTTYLAAADNFNTPAPSANIPQPPTSFASSPLNGAASLTWVQSPIATPAVDGYLVTATDGTTTFTYTLGDQAAVTITGLTNTVAYTVTIAAHNASGYSTLVSTFVTPDSAAGDVLPGTGTAPDQTNPGAPTLVSLTASDSTIGVVWTENTDTGNTVLTGYEVTATGSADIVVIFVPVGTGTTIGGLTNDSAYDVTVRAKNGFGYSVPSNLLTATPSAGLPPIDPPLPPDDPPPPVIILAPTLYAFPAGFLFRPSNWDLSPDDAAAAEVLT